MANLFDFAPIMNTAIFFNITIGLLPFKHLYVLIGREESRGKFHHCAIRNGSLPYMLSARWRSPPVLSTEKHDKSRKFEGGPYPILVSFFSSAGKRTNVAQRGKRMQEAATLARARLVKLFPPRTEKLLSNIRGSIWHQTALCACLYGVLENVH